MAFSEPEIVCKKHPNHKQQPGVCSCCLRERLSKLSGLTKNIYSTSSSHSASPVVYYSSASSSTYTSPIRRAGHNRIASDIMDYSLSFTNGINNGLKKSRSIAIVARHRVEDAVNRKKKGGFWSKLLLRSTGKKTKV
ncbi:putative ovule protein [Abeliophyllum distichum]|uniref:Ovule protein n=1 Tax=Abeliophyllum distichum TaxID=126358 RepID=A0ABD1SE48_9LAMI